MSYARKSYKEFSSAGCQRVPAMEYSFIPSLEVLAPAGFKVRPTFATRKSSVARKARNSMCIVAIFFLKKGSTGNSASIPVTMSLT